MHHQLISSQLLTFNMSAVASTIQHALEENAHPTQPQPGPLKQIIGKTESLDAQDNNGDANVR
jgi:hypothetical protein